MEVLGTAQLTREIDPQRAVAASVPRDQIGAILRDPEAQPELQLELRHDGEASRISMDWSRGELEDLFARATGDSVVLTFDREELAGAFADVEAHGLREKALVFAVAATGALGTGVGIASAQQAAVPGGGAAATAVAATSYSDVSSATTGLRPNPDLGAQPSRGAELPPASTSSGATFGIQRPDTTEVLLVGGVLLTIAGATFGVRRVTPGRPA
jgi:hypothetical protein